MSTIRGCSMDLPPPQIAVSVRVRAVGTPEVAGVDDRDHDHHGSLFRPSLSPYCRCPRGLRARHVRGKYTPASLLPRGNLPRGGSIRASRTGRRACSRGGDRSLTIRDGPASEYAPSPRMAVPSRCTRSKRGRSRRSRRPAGNGEILVGSSLKRAQLRWRPAARRSKSRFIG